jgi:hypothetical protein
MSDSDELFSPITLTEKSRYILGKNSSSFYVSFIEGVGYGRMEGR